MSGLDELRSALVQLQKELDDLKGKSTGKKPEQSEPVRHIVYVPRERKLRKFTGHPKIHLDQTAEEFIIDARSAISSMSPGDLTDFLLSHLKGAAKSEVRLRDECKDAESIFNVLAQSFGDNRCGAQLLRQFYDCKQREGEGVFSCPHGNLGQVYGSGTKRVEGPSFTPNYCFAGSVCKKCL